jgi:hypothetical protein
MRFGIKGKDATKIHFNKYVNQLINHPSREGALGTWLRQEGVGGNVWSKGAEDSLYNEHRECGHIMYSQPCLGSWAPESPFFPNSA